jgi:hypothetical protein
VYAIDLTDKCAIFVHTKVDEYLYPDSNFKQRPEGIGESKQSSAKDFDLL